MTILGDFYEDAPHNSHLSQLSEEFMALFYQLIVLFNLSCDTRGKVKNGTWVCNMIEKKKRESIPYFTEGDVFK